jgi:hypothetical protein
MHVLVQSTTSSFSSHLLAMSRIYYNNSMTVRANVCPVSNFTYNTTFFFSYKIEEWARV